MSHSRRSQLKSRAVENRTSYYLQSERPGRSSL
jgi:hypothetical protein